MAQVQSYILPEERRKEQRGYPEMSPFRIVVNTAKETAQRCDRERLGAVGLL